MKRYIPIRKICAREVLDSRGNPTVETEVIVGTHILGSEGAAGKAIVPSGASTGMQEAKELRDQDERYGGLGVQKAVGHVNVELAEAVLGEDALNQSFVDHLLLQTDGTENKEQLGANAVLSVSLAVADAAAKELRIPLFQYLGGCNARRMPVPMMNIMNGGKHADNTVDFQEFMIMPIGASCFREGVRMCAEIYHKLKEQLRKRGLSTAVGDEGGFAPDIQSTRDAFVLMEEAVELAGYRPGKDIGFAMDAAASELYEKGKKLYFFRGESLMTGKTVVRTSEEMIAYYETLVDEFPLLSIEDGLSEEDWEGWSMLTARLGKRIQLVGDDLFVTNKKILKEGILEGIGNAVLIKLNQIGTLSEAMETVSCAQKAGYAAVVSHRSGESEDTFLADLAVALQTGQIKTGAPCRGERTAKYNRLLEIEELLGESAQYENPFQIK